jgi:hypothetical protein
MVLHVVIVTKWSTFQLKYVDTNYCSANLKYVERYAEDMQRTYSHRGLPCINNVLIKGLYQIATAHLGVRS